MGGAFGGRPTVPPAALFVPLQVVRKIPKVKRVVWAAVKFARARPNVCRCLLVPADLIPSRQAILKGEKLNLVILRRDRLQLHRSADDRLFLFVPPAVVEARQAHQPRGVVDGWVRPHRLD